MNDNQKAVIVKELNIMIAQIKDCYSAYHNASDQFDIMHATLQNIQGKLKMLGAILNA